MKIHRKIKKEAHIKTRWRVAIGQLQIVVRDVVYGPKKKAEAESSRLFYEAYWRDEEPEEQVRLYSEALLLTPRDAQTYLCRGVAYDAMGQMDNALADFEHAIRLKPKLAEGYNNRGYLRYKQGLYAQAIPDFDRALQLNPDYAQAYCSRASAYGMLGRHEQALADIERAIEVDPDFLLAYVNRAAYNLNMNHVAEAEQELRWVLEQCPDDNERELAEKYLAICDESRRQQVGNADRSDAEL